MRFFARKKRQPPAVIIVALVDVLIVLLIFLMVTTSSKKPLTLLKLALPESSHTTKAGANDSPPLIVAIEANGGLRFGEDAKIVTLEELKKALLDSSAQNPHLKLSISADKGAPWGRVVSVMDAVKDASITNVSAFIKPAAAK